MTLFRAIQVSISSYIQAFQFISKHRLWNYLFISGLVSFLVSMLLFGSAVITAMNSSDWLVSMYPFERGSETIAAIGEWIMLIVLLLGTLFILKYVIIIALGPILSILSEKIEAIEKGDGSGSKFSASQFFKDFFRGLRINLRNVWKEMLMTVLLLILGLIPGLALITGPAILMIQSYYAGFGNFDLYLERHLNYNESVRFVRTRKELSAANGIIFLGILSIPVLGWILAPFLGVVSASLILNKEQI